MPLVAKFAAGTGTLATIYAAYSMQYAAVASPYSYGPLPIVGIEAVNSTTKKITVGLTPTLKAHLAHVPVPFHFNVKNTDLIVARSYTPYQVDLDKGTMSFLIKRYAIGETSKFIHRKIAQARGDVVSVEMNGPLKEFELAPRSPHVNDNATLGMIAGGTGVTPFLQIIDAALHHVPTEAASKDASSWPKLSLVYVSRSYEDYLERERLNKLHEQYPDRLKVKFVEGRSYLTRELLEECMPAPLTDGMILVCGPDGFVRHVAGRKGRDLYSQGPLGGLLSEMGYTAQQVHKF